VYGRVPFLLWNSPASRRHSSLNSSGLYVDAVHRGLVRIGRKCFLSWMGTIDLLMRTSVRRFVHLVVLCCVRVSAARCISC
jgi:hypothetical protein